MNINTRFFHTSTIHTSNILIIVHSILTNICQNEIKKTIQNAIFKLITISSILELYEGKITIITTQEFTQIV
jgi:hypothetical protein